MNSQLYMELVKLEFLELKDFELFGFGTNLDLNQ